jgi:hypothetical protein
MFRLRSVQEKLAVVSGSERLGPLNDYTANCRPVISSERVPNRYRTADIPYFRYARPGMGLRDGIFGSTPRAVRYLMLSLDPLTRSILHAYRVTCNCDVWRGKEIRASGLKGYKLGSAYKRSCMARSNSDVFTKFPSLVTLAVIVTVANLNNRRMMWVLIRLRNVTIVG